MDTDSLKIEKIITVQGEINSQLKGINYNLKKNINLIENNLNSSNEFFLTQSENLLNQNNQLQSLTTEIQVINENLEQLHADKIWGKVGYDTLFTVSATLFVFIVGFLIDRIIKKIGQKNKEKKIRKYFSNNVIKFSKNLLTPLISEYRKFYLEHDIDTGIPLTPPRVLTGEIARISEIDFKEIMESFDYNEEIFKTKQYVEFTGGIINDVEKYHNIVLDKSNIKRDNLQALLEEYIKLMASFLEDEKRRNTDYESFDLWNLINEKLYFFHTIKSVHKRLSIFYHEVLRPIQKFLVVTNYFRTHEQAGELAELGRVLSARYYEVRFLTAEVRCEYKKFHHSLNSISEKINNIIEASIKNN